ncbi:50S ribosomal protein L18 [Engelhardtia mirabilis]|uniref:Large ribosomal subunit protein uL18 n=1 Tax=Engelhardtia mirabilis TaxID=2528011 RepID=A0A518BPB9_9BACT|nr:50S ribosomal protein L18 [Planctomycetes bacterium Pla133]QDV03151.1 50S ribosomal protein L18 [Planctomycetes bacterium Pla86]
MKEALQKQARKSRRKMSVRAKLRRTASKPRLSVFRSSKHIYAQIIDDAAGRTVASVSSSSKAFAAENPGKTKTERAALIGAEIAKRSLDAGVEAVVLDRGAARYHGRVKALADAAREAGLKF